LSSEDNKIISIEEFKKKIKDRERKKAIERILKRADKIKW